MSRYHSYLNSAAEILSAYKGTEPFASYIKKVFSANKKFGSKDRKQIAHICYCSFRAGKLFTDADAEERLLPAVFLCAKEQNDLLLHLRPEWNNNVFLTVEEKLKLVGKVVDRALIFPFIDELSDGIEANEFVLSHFIQPDLFLRIRPGQKQHVLNKLTSAGISFEARNETCIAVPNSTKIEQLIELNKEAVVQDYSSQQVGEMLHYAGNKTGKIEVWDCCAASGGKSIMAVDVLKQIDLTVSDIRESILANLKKRFAEAGIIKYKSFVADLAANGQKQHVFYDLIIADVPCSGSGTWGRTPENLLFFEKKEIAAYSTLQKRIVANVMHQVKKGGYLLYITCSVFKKENEEIVEWMKQQDEFELTEMKLLKGYEQKADSMFAALMKKI
ncbi:MAG: Fmu (Sun) domain-containing protein [Lacibacter sp.]